MFQITGIAEPSTRFTNFGVLPADLLSTLLTFAIVGAGLFFFVRLISAGYGYLTNAGDQNKIQNASKELINAVIGLLLIISSFFIIQIIQTTLGVNIISSGTKSDQSPLDQVDRQTGPR